ncbi:agamous-like mads-box protein agl62 [Anaeramoeba flamelloides]|uniref:Agamous-like mads-box protein agl62 n=1 Tax=Anaeramoeba flamelloides TaxID=1746091 RepID=A0ABQ8X131_9EUKA|nr:agamous-like mads-box protein agl62 [Anaeramoeba flamelloides]
MSNQITNRIVWELWKTMKINKQIKLNEEACYRLGQIIFRKYKIKIDKHIINCRLKYLQKRIPKLTKKRRELYLNNLFTNGRKRKFGRPKKNKRERNKTGKFREKRKRKFKEITPMPGNKELMLLKILKKGHSYVDIDDYHVMSEKDYYKTMNILKPKFFKLLYSHFLENVKLCENYELVISFDGRWSSRRSGKQCSVNFIIVDGPKVLIGKLLLLISCQKISKKRKEKIENTIFYRYVELKSSQMEGFLVEYACELFKKFKLNIKIIVHDTDSKPYKIFKNHFSNVIDDFYDINHFLINYQKKIDKWRKQNADLTSLLRCFALSQGFSFRLKNWIAFSIKNGEKNFDEISALIFKFISHSEGNHYDCVSVCKKKNTI